MLREVCDGPCPSSSPEVGEKGDVAESPNWPELGKPGSSGRPGRPGKAPSEEEVELRRGAKDGRPEYPEPSCPGSSVFMLKLPARPLPLSREEDIA